MPEGALRLEVPRHDADSGFSHFALLARLNPLNAGFSIDIAANLSAHSALGMGRRPDDRWTGKLQISILLPSQPSPGMPLSSTSVPRRTNSLSTRFLIFSQLRDGPPR
jgi:hypothetical protein